MPEKTVHIVYEPYLHGAGLNHMKLAMITSGSIEHGSGHVYHVWKDGHKNRGFADEAEEKAPEWHGLKEGESHRRVGETHMANREIARNAEMLIDQNMGYGGFCNNCEAFAMDLSRRI